MTGINPNLAVIILNANGLNIPIKLIGFFEWSNYIVPTRDILFKDTNILKV